MRRLLRTVATIVASSFFLLLAILPPGDLHAGTPGKRSAGKESGGDLVPALAEAARKVARVAPSPAWSTVLRAAEADLIQFVPGNRVLVGEVGIAPGMPFLPVASTAYTGAVALYDAGTGRRLWSHERAQLPPGQYSVLAVAPVILLVGTEAKRAVYTALDPETGEVRWERSFGAPYAAVPSPDGAHLIVTSGGWASRRLEAVNLASGAVLWGRSLDRSALARDRPPLLSPVGDLLVVVGSSILGLSSRTGEEVWSVPSPLGDEPAAHAAAWRREILIAGPTRIALLDAATGTPRWSRGVEGGRIRVVVPSDAAVLVWTRSPGEGNAVRDVLSGLGPENGATLWNKDEGEIRGPLVVSGGRVYFTTEPAVVCRDARTGEGVFRTEVGDAFRRWGRSEGFHHLLPDLVEMRGEAIVVARETYGLAKLSARTGALLFAREIDWKTNSRDGFNARASDLFGAYWSGQMKALERAEARFAAVMSSLLEGATTAMQRIAETSVLVAGAGAREAGTGRGASGPRSDDEATRRQVAAYDRAIASEIAAGGTLADPRYQALALGRDLSREALRQESQARVATLGAERSVLAVRASMESMMATISLCNSVMSTLDGLSAQVREANGLRKYVDLRHAVEVHRGSLQQRSYLRPFRSRDARGMIVVDLDTGARADFLYAVTDDFFKRDIGVDLPGAVESPDGARIVTQGIALDPAAYETYRVAAFRLPCPSVLSFDRAALFGRQTVEEYDVAEAAAKGDLASVRALLSAGADPDARDGRGAGALVLAARGGHVEVVRALLGAGGRLDLPDGQQNLPLAQAILQGHEAVVRALIEAGADLNAFDPHGQAPLCWAVVAGRPGVVRLLMSGGAKVERMHARLPVETVLKDAGLIRGLCTDDGCRKRFDETIALVRAARAE